MYVKNYLRRMLDFLVETLECLLALRDSFSIFPNYIIYMCIYVYIHTHHIHTHTHQKFINVLTPVKLKLFKDYLKEQLLPHIDFTKWINFVDKL